jgi:phage terminase large subunit-like protein
VTTLVVPALEEEPWPTLGPQIKAVIEENLVYGPGDLRGQPYRVAPDFAAWLYRAYEVFPKGHPRAGKRRFKRVAISERKGTAKTEKAAVVAAVEAHPEGPVRCDGFDAYGQPVGRPVNDPYIPLVAYTQDQTEELAFGALYVILSESAWADDFDIGLERIVVLNERGRAAGKVVPLAGSPNARDGARTTFQHFDETHRLILENLRKAHRTMLANIPKRPMADPWSLETTTSFTPGEGSVAETTMEYAKEIVAGKVRDPRLFFFHRQAGDDHDLATYEGRTAAVVEASGPAAEWSDIDTIVSQWDEPDADPAYLERVWLNRPRPSSAQAFNPVLWKTLASEAGIPWRSKVTLGFDGSKFHDTTALVATDLLTGFQQLVGFWDPAKHPDDEIPEDEVSDVVMDCFRKWKVMRLYADPPYWETAVDRWAGRYGSKKVQKWWTNRPKPMSFALKAYSNAIQSKELSHDGDPRFAEHIGNAWRYDLSMVDDQGKPLWVIRKERHDSPKKIDAAMAGCLSWEARRDCIAAGLAKRQISASW